MSQSFNFIRIIGKAAYLLGVLLLFNFFFGLLFFRFLPWLIMGTVLFLLFTSALSIGKRILFSGFEKTGQNNARRADKRPGYSNGEVIDVEAEVFEDDQEKE